MAGVLMGTLSCSDDDGPKRGDGVFTVNTPMINHMVNTSNGQVLGIANTHNKLTFDTVKHTASLELRYHDGGIEKTLKLDNITAKPKRLGLYELYSSSDANFSGYVDIYQGPSMCYRYTTPEGIRIISTLPEISFLDTHTLISYDDTTKATTMDNVMYQFTISPSTSTAVIEVMPIEHAKDLKYFYNITAPSAPMTVTREGYLITGQNIATRAKYRSWTDSVGTATDKYTDNYPFKTFNAVLNLEKDSINVTFMMGSSATVVATGKTYRESAY